jgi:hypothetical protein
MKAARWTPEQLQAYQAKTGKPVSGMSGRSVSSTTEPTKAKFRNTKVEVDGQKFDSKKEAHRWSVLRILEEEGTIFNLVRQVTFSLQPAVNLAGEKRKKPALRYTADFVYVAEDRLIVEDTKSDATRKLASYRNKKHLMKTLLKLDITEV